MEPLPYNLPLLTLSASTLTTCNKELTVREAGKKEYEPLLFKIAFSFGFIDSETMELVQQVCSCFNAQGADRQRDNSLRIRLSKMMVQQCIFKISHQLCSQSSDAKKTGRPDMPLSYRSVFLLHDTIGFNEREIAEVLNTNVLQVKQRLNKALLFIHHQHQEVNNPNIG